MSDYGYDSDDLEFIDDDAWLYIAEDDQLAVRITSNVYSTMLTLGRMIWPKVLSRTLLT